MGCSYATKNLFLEWNNLMKQRSSLMASAAAFLLMMSMAITTTVFGFFVTPVCEDLGLSRGSFTIYVSLMTVSASICTPMMGQYINRKGVRDIILISGIWCSIGFVIFSFANSVWVFYLTAILIGMFTTNCVSLCATVVVQQTYSEEKASGVLGIVMAGSGVGGMILSLIVPGLIQNYGWRMGYRFAALCWMVLVLGAYFLLGGQKISGNIAQRKQSVDGMTRAEALRSPMLYLLMAAMFAMTASSCIQPHLPALLGGMDFSTAQVSVMVSVMTASLAVGKILQGLLYSKVGILKGSVIMLALFAMSFLLLLSSRTVYPGLVSLAFGLGTITTLLPTVTRAILGSKEYPAIWSIISTTNSVSAFLMTPLWGMVYDTTGSYRLALILSPILIAISLVALLVAFRMSRK